MPRPRTPTAILVANGSFKHDPARAKTRVLPASDVSLIGEPPPELPDDVKAAWCEITSTATPGVLITADTIAVRSCARLLARENGGMITTQERAQLHKLLENFGMHPRGRNYIHVPTPKAHNPFSDFGR